MTRVDVKQTQPDERPLLLVENMSKGFPGVQALDRVRFELHAGEVHALVGENGAGKSTLMKILSGIYRRDSGIIALNGVEIEVATPLTAQMLGISIIHQELNLIPDLTVAQNIFVGRETTRWGRLILNDRVINQRARELLDRLGISLDSRVKVADLKVAQQQLVEIAKALSFNARVLIMDEPTAAITDQESEILFRLLRGLRAQGTGIIYISHRMEELKEISDRITVFRDGCYVDTVETTATSTREVVAMMVGREITSGTRPTLAPQPDQKSPMLQVRGLSTAGLLDDVSFDLYPGEILGFAGLMGAGRTEVARVVCGADRADDVDVRVMGKHARIRDPSDAVRMGIGYLSEDRKRYGLMLEQDVRFNIGLSSLGAFSGPFGFVHDRKLRRACAEYIESMRIKTPSMYKLARNLSGGNQQKMVVAKWLLRDCDILIFDEPTRGIDVGAKEEVYALLEELAAAGKGIIMISSELPEVLRLSHRIIVMADGRITVTLENRDLAQETIMEYATRMDVEELR